MSEPRASGPGSEAEIRRRVVLRRLAGASVAVGATGALAALGLLSPGRFRPRPEARRLPDFRRPGPTTGPALVAARGHDPARLTRAAVEAAGGMARFVLPGEAVLVKPNMAWDRTPEQGANTHPAVVAEVVRLCREAGAGRVLVADHPVHEAARVAARSGIRQAALAAGAEVLLPAEADFSPGLLSGSVLETWEVLSALHGVQRLINVPVAKVHSLSLLTCGLKNLYGVLGGNRGRLHQEVHATIADVAAAVRPTLTVVDATRLMVRGGPTGGRLDDVRPGDAVAAGSDPVAADAWAARLLGLDPRAVAHVVEAEGRGLGSLSAEVGEVHAG